MQGSDKAILNHPQAMKYQKKQEQDEKDINRSVKWYFVSWGLMMIAIVVFIAVYFIAERATDVLWAQHYENDSKLSPYYKSEKAADCNFAVSQTIVANLYTQEQYKKTEAIALGILLTWMMWKMPLSIYTLYLIWDNESKIVKFITWGVYLLLLLGFDILLTVFVGKNYYEAYYFGANAIFTCIVSVINNKTRIKSAVACSLLPMLYIAVAGYCYHYFFPWLYRMYSDNAPNASIFIQIYLFPLWDCLFYSLLLLMNNFIHETGKPFLRSVQFLLTGYFVGMTLLVGVTQVQFYFLVGYLLFRNFFTNYVMYNWLEVINNPPCLPVWIAPYYLSYAFNFIPIFGVGPLAVSKSYFSQQFSQACMILFYYPTSQYPYSTQTPESAVNSSLKGYIFWVGAVVIWVVHTFTQKYSQLKPSPFDIFFNIFGIYLFYFGITAALELPTLSQIVFK